MKASEFKLLEPVADALNDKFEDLHRSGAFDTILRQLREKMAQLPEEISISLDIRMTVFDARKEKGILLLNTGLNCQKNQEPYQYHGDSTPQKYYVNGEMCIVPHDYCPNCWGTWDFKFKDGVCPNCRCELGKEVKYLLDDDVCPWCRQGKVTVEHPVCDQCNFEVDPQRVVWG